MNFWRNSKQLLTPPTSFSENYIAIFLENVRKKPHIKVQNLQHNFLDWTWPPTPLEVFRKFIGFDSLTRPLQLVTCCKWRFIRFTFTAIRVFAALASSTCDHWSSLQQHQQLSGGRHSLRMKYPQRKMIEPNQYPSNLILVLTNQEFSFIIKKDACYSVLFLVTG